MGDDKKSFWGTLLGKLWESFLEKFLVPIVIAAIMGGFTLWSQKTDKNAAEKVQLQVAESINKELPKALENMRQKINEQQEGVNLLKSAILELRVQLAVEQELRKAGDRRRERQVAVPASQPADPLFDKLKARKAGAPLPPPKLQKVQARF
jgi:hypothetical protein